MAEEDLMKLSPAREYQTNSAQFDSENAAPGSAASTTSKTEPKPRGRRVEG